MATFIRGIDIDITINIRGDESMDEDQFPFRALREHAHRRWMRHMAMVPKGFLRYQLPKMLNEKPMSGSEIMSEIEKQTNGRWKPSPGSIYPLLAWLQDKGYIKEITEQEPGIRRYTLTEQGKQFLEEQIKAREELDKRFEHFGPTHGLGRPMWFGFDRKNAAELRKAAKDFAIAIRNLYHEMRREYSETIAEEAKKTLEEATRKIQDTTKKLQE